MAEELQGDSGQLLGDSIDDAGGVDGVDDAGGGLVERVGLDIFATLTPSEQGMARRTWAAQEQFLAGHRAGGTVSAGCYAAAVSRRTVVRWRADDRYGFLERMDGAHEDFADRLETIGLELIQALKPGQNTLLLLAYLNAHRSRLFRPQATPDATVARDTLAELRRLRKYVDKPDQGDGADVQGDAGAELLRSALEDHGAGPGGDSDQGDDLRAHR